MSTVDRARDNLSAANTRFGVTARALHATREWAAHTESIDDLRVAELDLEDAMRADGEI